jgi:hypothetical protein
MGIGVIALQTSQKREQSGPPFVTGSANNGLSVDAVSGKIVLGNDTGDPLAPAALLSDREILTEDVALNNFAVLLNAIQTSVLTRLSGSIIEMIGTNGALARIRIQTDAAGLSLLDIRNVNDMFTLDAGNNPGTITFSAGQIVASPWLQVDTATRAAQIGSTLVASNTATLQVTGTLTNRLFISGIGAGTTNVDRDLDSGKLFFNSAAANLALPNMAGANTRTGFILRANCAAVAGITITASAGQTIRFGSLATSSGGTLSSTDVGAYAVITLINSATWVTETFNGAWVLT